MPLLFVLLLTTAAGDDAATTEAKALYAQGKQAFEAGRYPEALAGFEAAYARKALPGFLFNIGLCHRALNNHGKAVEALERYLRAMPNAPNRAEAENLLDEERAAAAAASAPPPAPIPPPPPPPPPPGAVAPPAAPPLAAPPPVASPAAVAPLEPAEPPPVAKPEPKRAPPPKVAPKPDEPIHGMDTLPAAAVQTAGGLGGCVGGCCVALPFTCLLGLVPVVGPFASACVGALIIGSSIGVTETWLGDWLGKKRGALVWPALLAVGALGASSLANVTIATIAGTAPSFQNGALTANPVQTGVTAAIGCCGLTTAIVGPVVLYHLIAVDKEPGDTGGFPGLLEPADPTGSRGATRTASSSAPRAALAMRY